MKQNMKKRWLMTGILFFLFAAFTVLVSVADVQPIGPEQSEVGLATLNGFVFEHIGVNMTWYHITEWLGMAVLLVPAGFAALGLCQLIQRKSLWKVDTHLLLLGVFYALVAVCYVLFEKVIINYRPVVFDEGLEASYPSSHTMLAVCVLATAMMVIRRLPVLPQKYLKAANPICVALLLVTVVGRLLSGVHWFTDIVGGVLLSAALVMLYASACICVKHK